MLEYASDKCISAILENGKNTTETIGALTNTVSFGEGSNSPPENATTLCERLGFMGLGEQGSSGVPGECSAEFNEDGWIQSFTFATANGTDNFCGKSPSRGSAVWPLAVWGTMKYS